jgi:hypothetical protein
MKLKKFEILPLFRKGIQFLFLVANINIFAENMLQNIEK